MSVSVRFWDTNTDVVIVENAKSPAQAWDAAEDFLTDYSEDKDQWYSTGLSGVDDWEKSHDGTYEFPVVVSKK